MAQHQDTAASLAVLDTMHLIDLRLSPGPAQIEHRFIVRPVQHFQSLDGGAIQEMEASAVAAKVISPSLEKQHRCTAIRAVHVSFPFIAWDCSSNRIRRLGGPARQAKNQPSLSLVNELLQPRRFFTQP